MADNGCREHCPCVGKTWGTIIDTHRAAVREAREQRADVAPDDVRERHQKDGDWDACDYCGSKVTEDGWPCDAIRMADAYDEAMAELRAQARIVVEVGAKYDEANADAERLAEALERVAQEGQAPTYVLDALRQHDERVSG